MLPWLRHIYYAYAVCLPGLALAAGLILDLPILSYLGSIDSGLVFFILLVAIIPLACYLDFVTELVPFPTRLPPALFTLLFIPVELILSLWLNNVSLWNLFIIHAATELLGVMSLITVLVTKKMLTQERNWFFATILIGGSLVACVIAYFTILPLLPSNFISYGSVLLAIGAISWRYYGYLASNQRNAVAPSAQYILIGLATTIVIPGLTWLLLRYT